MLDRIERLLGNADRLIDAGTKAGVAYLGYKATRNPAGALAGLVALRLAEGGNLAAGAAGLGALVGIGIISNSGLPPIVNPELTAQEKLAPYQSWSILDYLQALGSGGFLKVLYP